MFIPISAENAFVYRTASRLSFAEFQNLDKSIIEKLGQAEVACFQWRKMSLDEKHQAAYDIVSNKDKLDASLLASNFHVLLEAIGDIMGGKETQLRMIEKQIDVTLQGLTFDVSIAKECRKVYDMHKLLGIVQTNQVYMNYFFDAFEPCYVANVKAFEVTIDHKRLHAILLQLIDFHSFVQYIEGDKEDNEAIVQRMETVVRLQIHTVVEQSKLSERETKFLKNPASYGITEGRPFNWDNITPHDVYTIANSVLLLSFHKSFCLYFGREKVSLEAIVRDYAKTRHSNGAFQTHVDGTYDKATGEFLPVNPDQYRLLAQIEMPRLLSDPDHWGYLVWMFFEFLDAQAKP